MIEIEFHSVRAYSVPGDLSPAPFLIIPLQRGNP